MIQEIKIENLKCSGCAATIKKEILSLEHIANVDVDIENSMVVVTLKNTTSESATLEVVKHKLSKLGYPEVGNKNTVFHKAKSFVSCAVGRIDS